MSRWKRSPRVTNRLPSRANASREPKCMPPVVPGSWRKITFIVVEPAAGCLRYQLCACYRRAVGPVAARLGEREVDELGRGEVGAERPRRAARLGACASTCGTPPKGCDRLPSLAISRMRPGRSVTSARPSGRKARPQGFTRPRAKVSTLGALLLLRRWRIGDRGQGRLGGQGSSSTCKRKQSQNPHHHLLEKTARGEVAAPRQVPGAACPRGPGDLSAA